ncbi:MAG: GNAT family N-acetyltransferase [bacterium]|nr:GNAT family N-acetyltransferase [bacterium]
MIRKLEVEDIETVCKIVNNNWIRVYQGYVNPVLIDENGCKEREIRLKKDFRSKRLSEYVWEEQGQVVAMLSIGETADTDRIGDFEVWRIYIDSEFQGKGIGSQMLNFAEETAKAKGYSNIVIWAFKNNIPAISFYNKHGYTIEKEEYLGETYQAYGVRLIKEIGINLG